MKRAPVIFKEKNMAGKAKYFTKYKCHKSQRSQPKCPERAERLDVGFVETALKLWNELRAEKEKNGSDNYRLNLKHPDYLSFQTNQIDFPIIASLFKINQTLGLIPLK